MLTPKTRLQHRKFTPSIVRSHPGKPSVLCNVFVFKRRENANFDCSRHRFTTFALGRARVTSLKAVITRSDNADVCAHLNSRFPSLV